MKGTSPALRILFANLSLYSIKKASRRGFDFEYDDLPASLNPSWKPLAGASDEDRKSIIARILRHAAALSTPGTSMLRAGQSLQNYRAGLTLVSREFNVRLSFVNSSWFLH